MGLRNLKSHFMKENIMNKLLAAMTAVLFAVSVNVFAADAAAPKVDAKPTAEVAAPAETSAD